MATEDFQGLVFAYSGSSQNCPGNPLPATIFTLPGECGGASNTGHPVVCGPTLYSDPASPQDPSVTATLTFQYYMETEPNPSQPNVGPFSFCAMKTEQGDTGELSAANCPCPCPPPDLRAILAPDQVFLVTGLDDSRVDPVLVQKRLEAPRRDDLRRGDPPSAGPPNARAVVVVFSDFECPYCKGAVPVLKDALNLETHDVRVVFRNYPLSFHPWALRAALSGRCAAEQRPADFWKIHDFFFDKQGEITVGNVDEKARGFLGGIPDFDLARYNVCLSDDGARRAIQADIDLGNANGVAGTPSVYVNGRKFGGELTVERLRHVIAGTRQEAAGTFNQHAETR